MSADKGANVCVGLVSVEMPRERKRYEVFRI